MSRNFALHAERRLVHDRREVEQRLARELREFEVVPEVLPGSVGDDVPAGELLQLAWDRAEQEIDELRTELRLMRQRHQEAERQLLARINHRKRLQQAILESAGHPPASA